MTGRRSTAARRADAPPRRGERWRLQTAACTGTGPSSPVAARLLVARNEMNVDHRRLGTGASARTHRNSSLHGRARFSNVISVRNPERPPDRARPRYWRVAMPGSKTLPQSTAKVSRAEPSPWRRGRRPSATAATYPPNAFAKRDTAARAIAARGRSQSDALGDQVRARSARAGRSDPSSARRNATGSCLDGPPASSSRKTLGHEIIRSVTGCCARTETGMSSSRTVLLDPLARRIA